LLFFGLLRAYKGLDLLVQALARVPDARLVVAGDPVDPVEPIRQLRVRAGRPETEIDGVLGFLPDAEVFTLMADAAAVVLAYRQADSSGVLADRLRPTVARPSCPTSGGLAEAVRAYDAGLVVPPDDVEALADACRALLADPGPAYRGALAALPV
jgi:glycosyltransferase involved in cell wall biosynthesis